MITQDVDVAEERASCECNCDVVSNARRVVANLNGGSSSRCMWNAENVLDTSTRKQRTQSTHEMRLRAHGPYCLKTLYR